MNIKNIIFTKETENVNHASKIKNFVMLAVICMNQTILKMHFSNVIFVIKKYVLKIVYKIIKRFVTNLKNVQHVD
jgi:uncharacterized membrane protein